MAYNYAAAYGTSYGQYAAQASSFGTQQTSASGYGHYGQAAAAYGTASSGTATATSTTATNLSSRGYGSYGASTTTAQSSYSTGFNYNYGRGSSNAYNSAAAASSNTQQSFQQSWYGNTSVASSPAVNQQPAATAQAATQQQQQQQQQQQYGQYLQQYQQQMAAYQQYGGSLAGKTDNNQQQQQQQQQQQATAWTGYNQSQQRGAQHATSAAAAGTNTANAGWGAYQQQGASTQQNSAGSQQKSTGVVYRTPMKYSSNNQLYGTSNSAQDYSSNNQQQQQQQQQPFKSPSTNSNYSSSTSQHYNQGYGNNSNKTQAQHQQYRTNQSYGGVRPQQQQYGGNQGPRNTPVRYSQNHRFQDNQSAPGNFNTQGYGNQPRGGFGGPNNSNTEHMNMQGPQHRGIRPQLTQRSPIGGGGGGGPGYGSNGRPRDGPDIPPFPRAWHSQDGNNIPRRGYNEQKERWGPGPGDREGPGRFNQPNHRAPYSNNSRNPRGAAAPNRELWSPAPKPIASRLPEKEAPAIPPPAKKDNEEKVDKEKHPEIKSYLYAWLGVQRTRPIYDIRQIRERPNILFRCDLRVDKYSFVGVGKATSKKEAQTTAAWNFAEYLVEIGEVKQTDLPNKQIAPLPEDIEDDIGEVREENKEKEKEKEKEKDSEEKMWKVRPSLENDNRNRDRRGPSRGRGNRHGNQNWGPGPDKMGEIMPLMAVPVVPWGAQPPPPMGPPPRMMRPQRPGMMDYGPPFWDSGPRPWMRPPMGMGPPIRPLLPMRPPPPFMRRGPQNEFFRQRGVEERMMDLSQDEEWAHPEDMFISQMIRNQQEGERRQRGSGGAVQPTMESTPGEWERVQEQVRPAVTSDDRHVMAKHRKIYPQEGELKNLHRIINTVEQALKLLSDKFVNEDHPRNNAKKQDAADISSAKKEDVSEEMVEEESAAGEAGGKKEATGEKNEQTGESESKEEKVEMEGKEESESKEEKAKTEKKAAGLKKKEKRAMIKILKRPKRMPKQVDTRPRVLCGVNRIGPLAKGLLITKDDRVELALLCGEIPTKILLGRVVNHIEEKLREVDDEFKLTVERKDEEAGFLVKSLDESSPVEVMVILTATVLRKVYNKMSEEKQEEDKEEQQEKDKEEAEEEPLTEPDPAGMLPKRKMLDALACLRHTHWFQTKACTVQSCVILTRILRDMQRRDEKWSCISEWALEVIIFNCLSSSGEQLSPGDACRRFFEAIAGGILLPNMPGIADPCEKLEPRDLLDCLTVQQREDITSSAQTHLRRLAFKEIHVVLCMDKLSPSSRHDNQPGNKSWSRGQDTEGKSEEKPKVSESNNQRKRRFEPNESDSAVESPKRSLTDEEDTDTQQNLAELSISDGASEGRAVTLDETENELKKSEGDELQEEDISMEALEAGEELTKAEEDALLDDDDKMST